jgi:hypothetical protein
MGARAAAPCRPEDHRSGLDLVCQVRIRPAVPEAVGGAALTRSRGDCDPVVDAAGPESRLPSVGPGGPRSRRRGGSDPVVDAAGPESRLPSVGPGA